MSDAKDVIAGVRLAKQIVQDSKGDAVFSLWAIDQTIASLERELLHPKIVIK